jgi:hypothetical protein
MSKGLDKSDCAVGASEVIEQGFVLKSRMRSVLRGSVVSDG